MQAVEALVVNEVDAEVFVLRSEELKHVDGALLADGMGHIEVVLVFKGQFQFLKVVLGGDFLFFEGFVQIALVIDRNEGLNLSHEQRVIHLWLQIQQQRFIIIQIVMQNNTVSTLLMDSSVQQNSLHESDEKINAQMILQQESTSRNTQLEQAQFIMQQKLALVQPPQILDSSQVLKSQTFDFNKIRPSHRRKRRKHLQSLEQIKVPTTKGQQDSQNLQRASSVSNKKRLQQFPDLINKNCSKFEDCNLQSSQLFLDLNQSNKNLQSKIQSISQTALLSSRIQSSHLYGKIQQNYERDFDQKVQFKNNRKELEFNEGEESPLKAMKIARRQSILNQRGISSRRESLFGSNNIQTNDPLQKLLQTKKYIQSDMEHVASGQRTERVVSRKQSSFIDIGSSNTFKNELLQKTLNQSTIKELKQEETPSGMRAIMLQKDSKSQTDEESKSSALSLQVLNTGKSARFMINDTLQQAQLMESISEFNKESNDFNSLTIHLGVLLKKALSKAQQTQSVPCYFLTQICCQIMDKVSLCYPSFSRLLVPLKNVLFSSIFMNYDIKKHNEDDQRALLSTENEIDITKKDPRIEIKYLKYETYHDKFKQLQKQNKSLKKEVLAYQQQNQQEKKLKCIVNNMAVKFREIKRRALIKQIFLTLKYHDKQKYQGLYQQVLDKQVTGSEAKNKNLLRKFYQDWLIFSKNSKLRKARKEIEYFQNKVDDLEETNAQQRMQLRELSTNNVTLKEILNEKNSKIAKHEKEAAQFKHDNSKKKPNQVQQCLKIYFKYMFTNPLIARLRLKNSINLNALIHNDYEYRRSSLYKVQKDSKPKINLNVLLKKKETFQEGGYGVQTLLNLPLKEIMTRWVNYMMERAILKLNPIIEILKEEVLKENERYSKNPAKVIQERHENSSDSEENDQISNRNDFFSGYLQLKKVPNEKDFEPFKNFKKDLRLLLTFKEMISKEVNDLSLNLIQEGVLQALLFVINNQQRSLEVKTKNQVIIKSPISSSKSFGQKPLKSFQYNEEHVEEIVVPDYLDLLLYVHDFNVENRLKLVIQQVENINYSKLDWFFSESELLIGREANYVTILYYLFYSHSCLEEALQQPRMIRSAGYEQRKEEEQKRNQQCFKKIQYSTRQKVFPLLMRKVHSNLQDLSLMFSPDEVSANDNQKVLEQLLQLPLMEPKVIMMRWANHLLRSFNELKLIFELETKFKQKFTKEKGNEEVKQMSPANKILQSTPTDKSPSKKQQHSSSVSPMRKRMQDSLKKEESPKKMGNIRVTSETQTQKMMKKLNPDLQDLGFEIQKLSQLSQQNYHRLLMILIFLSPETLWDMFEMDNKELKQLPHLIEVADDLICNMNLDTKLLFIMNAVSRITKKNNLISLDELYEGTKIDYLDLLIELFLSRPSLSNSRVNSYFIQSMQMIEDFYNSQKTYLKEFGREQYQQIEDHINALISKRQDLSQAFAFIQDNDKIFYQLKDKLIRDRLNFPNPSTIIARQMKIYERSEVLLSEVENQILTLNRAHLFSLLTFRQVQQGNQWANQIESVIRKYLYPFRRYLNIFMDQDGYITYFDMWRAIKSLNIRSFNLDSREIENIIIKLQLIKIKDSRVTTRRALKDEEDQFSAAMDQDKEAELFIKKIKSEIQYTVFSKKNQQKMKVNLLRQQHRFRSKSSIVKEIEESLENASIKTQLYRAKFQACDLILVLVAILFRQNPSDFVKELIKIKPQLYEDGIKNVNKMLSKEKIQLHVEAYLTEYQPHQLFEQFLIHNVFIKSDFSKKHPFRFNMMKDDFRSFLDYYLNSLFAVFDFYLHEYATAFPQNFKYKHFCIQVESVYTLLRDFNAFNPESGLTKNSLRKILTNIQKQVTSEAKGSQIQTKTNPFDAIVGEVANKSASPINKSQSSMSQAGDTVASQIAQGFQSLVFFEFMELLYLVSQYYSPDPFVNPNQKFAEFLEKIVFVNIQFKIKGKRLQESPHKKNLIQSLESHKVKRGASLETFNAYFDLH